MPTFISTVILGSTCMSGYAQYLEKNIQVKKNLSKERNPTFISTVILGSTCMSDYGSKKPSTGAFVRSLLHSLNVIIRLGGT